jgi:hemin uptake protein HemP
MTIQIQDSFARFDPQPANRPTPIPVHRAEDLTGGGSLANIDLGGQVYALRITRAGKLILTK